MKSNFVAREGELAQLEQALDSSLVGLGQVRFVSGEAGSGKTTLITEFVRRTQARHADLVVAVGTCNAQTGIGDPYLPFREILRLLAGDVESKLVKSALTQENTRRLKGLAHDSAQALAEIGPDLIGIFLPGIGILAKVGAFVADKAGWLGSNEKTKPVKVSEEIDESRIFEQYAAVLRQLSAQNPLVLVLDDLQWVDQASAGLLFYLIRQLRESRVLILGLYRPAEVALGRDDQRHPFDKVLAETKRYYGDITLDLDRAGLEQGRRFVEAFLDTEANRLGEEFRAALFRYTEGHPLFTVELLRHMQERGDLVEDDNGVWIEGATIDWNTLPSRVEGVIEERIGRLEESLKDILKVASVEGEEFTAQIIARLKTLDELDLLDNLCAKLDQQHHLIHEQGEIEVVGRFLARFHFAHTLFQQYLYQRALGAAQRRSLHRKIGELLEELYGEHTNDIVLQLARHFEEAGLWEKAVDYRLRAGEQARTLYACEDAIEHLERALVLINKLPCPARAQPRLRALSALGELLTITGKYDSAREQLKLALELARQTENQDVAAHICRWMARSYENAGDYSPALDWVKQGLETLNERATAEAVQLHLIAGLVYLRRGEDLALEQAQSALRIAQALNDPHALGRTYLLLAVITLQRGQNQRSVDLARRGLALYMQANDLAGQATAHNQIANALFNMGRWSQAAQSYRQAREIFRRIGDLYNRAFVENNLGEIALNQGRLEDALVAYREALRLLEQTGGSDYALGVLHNNLGAVLICQGAFEAAHAQLQVGRACFEQVGSRDILPELHRHLAELALRQGNLEEAETQGMRSLALARELAAQNEAGITLRLLGEIALAQKDFKMAAECLGQGLSTLQSLGETFQVARTHLALARLALALGRKADARTELDHCAPVFERLDVRPEQQAVRELRAALAG